MKDKLCTCIEAAQGVKTRARVMGYEVVPMLRGHSNFLFMCALVTTGVHRDMVISSSSCNRCKRVDLALQTT